MDETSWKKAKDVLYEAVRLPVAEREAFVRRHFEDRPDICGEVLDILRGAEEIEDESLVSDPLSKPLISLVNYDFDQLADLVPSTRIKQYSIVDRLGRGGMGQVFLAHDDVLQRQVAMKCLLSRSSPEADRNAILAEARAAAAIGHKNVASVYEIVERGDRAFMVMEYVDGESLSARLARARLPLIQAVDIAIELADALRAAHTSGVVHGDLKPANIQVTTENTVKILDFGVARIVRTAAGVGSTTTVAGRRVVPAAEAIAGTPGYMSREQLHGERIDGRSDVYSLGVVLFEMVTGRRPYPGSSVEELREAVKKPAPRADSIVPAVPQRLADVIAMALDARVEARYQSAAEMEQALTAVREMLRQRSRRELVLWWLARVAVGIPLAFAALVLIGMMTTLGFNAFFGRTGPYARFGAESLGANLQWGALAVFPSLFVAMLVAVTAAASGALLRGMQTIGPIGRSVQRARGTLGRHSIGAGLHRPTGLAQTVAGLALLMLLLFTQLYRDVIFAWGSSFNSSPISALLPIGENQKVRNRYNQYLDVSIPVFSYGLYRVLRLRRREGSRDGAAAVAVLGGVIAIFVLMREWPYRTFNHRDFERVEFNARRCYVNGESDAELLVLCPGDEPPRNHVVRRDDPGLRRLGTIENVFRGVDPKASRQ